MADGASSPLFMPQGSPEGISSPSKNGEGSGNGSSRGSVCIKSEHGTPELQGATDPALWDDLNSKIKPIPGTNMEPEVKDERSPSPSRHINPFPARGRPTRPPRPFAPLTSRAERNRRKAASESVSNDNDATPDHAIADTALGATGEDMQTAVQLASLAGQNVAAQNSTTTNAPRGNVPTHPATQAKAAPYGPRSAPPATQAVDTGDFLIRAHHHLDTLAANLRKQQNDACDREEHLAALLEQARAIRACAIQDRSNGLVVIRDRKRKLNELEKRLLNNETIDPAELVGLVDLLKLEEPVERGKFERMRIEGKGVDHEDGYETDPLGLG
jgi:hypothetical protein